MTIACSTMLRTARAQSIITAAGANAKMKFYDGTRPASGAGIGGSTLLAMLIAGLVVARNAVRKSVDLADLRAVLRLYSLGGADDVSHSCRRLLKRIDRQ